MEVAELLNYRRQILNESKDADGFITESGFMDICLPALNETKHTETTDVSDIYCRLDDGSTKINAYTQNDSGERLLLFIVDEDYMVPDLPDEQALVSQKQIYEKRFARATSFLKKAIRKQLEGVLQDGAATWLLAHQLGSSSEFLDLIDSVDIFLLTLTATVERRGAEITPKSIEFEEEIFTVNFARNGQKHSKELGITYHLIDLNFLYSVNIAQNNRAPLTIDFSKAPFNYPIPCLPVANEAAFDAYLCAIPATLLAALYKKYSSRLLEKNVRSFLQLTSSVNRGMQETIRKEPDRFIAYNNGLTITATASDVITHEGVPCIRTLTDFQIVNGGQTTATIYFSQKSGLDITKISVMAKINVAKDATDDTLDDLIASISTYSNAQSRVSKVDLRSRSPQLIRLKSLSESILTVSGKKWFFERAKGEYATMLRINAGRKAQIEKAFPKERRFTKEELAKYYAAWGTEPYAVKKGGEKIFRIFIQEISGEGKVKKVTPINRSFYEDLVARIILFRSLEKLHGIGPNAIGQLRSAVVPYTLSILYHFTTGNKKAKPFDLLKIWKAEKLNDDLAALCLRLMKLVNSLIRKYARSDDFGEYAKKEELWSDIVDSMEIRKFITEPDVSSIIDKYTISNEELKKREKQANKEESIDFEPLLHSATILDKGEKFYKAVQSEMYEILSPAKLKKLENILTAIKGTGMLDTSTLNTEKELMKEITINHPYLLDKLIGGEAVYEDTAQYIIGKYNSAVEKGEDVAECFIRLRDIAGMKKALYYSVYGEIGKQLNDGTLPSLNQLKQASYYARIVNFGKGKEE